MKIRLDEVVSSSFIRTHSITCRHMGKLLTSHMLLHSQKVHGQPLIADVAVRKCHQRQAKNFIFFTRTLLESAKLFFCQ